MSKSGPKNQFSRRDFLRGSLAASVTTVALSYQEKAEAVFNTGAFWKGTSSAAQAAMVGQSLRFRANSSPYFSKTPALAGDTKKWTYSVWVKRGKLTSNYPSFLGNAPNGAGDNFSGYFDTDDTILITFNNSLVVLKSTAVFRDTSAWLHILLIWDTANATTAYKCRVYVNGLELTSFTTDNRASISSSDSSWNKAILHYLMGSSNVLLDFDGYATQVCFVDGQALSPSYFGSTDSLTGAWVPKTSSAINTAIAATGTKWGKNGFMLEFADNSAATAAAIGKDTATIDGTYHTAANNWTPNAGIYLTTNTNSQWDSMVDSPSNGMSGVRPAGNYPTLNPLFKHNTNGASAVEGNLKLSPSASAHSFTAATLACPTSGKWYCEYTLSTIGASDFWAVGLTKVTPAHVNDQLLGDSTSSYGFFGNGGAAYARYNGSNIWTPGITFADGAVIGLAYDANAHTLDVYYNGSLNGTFTGISSEDWYFAFGGYNSGYLGYANFGQRPFSQTVPSGFVSLCTANLPDPTIKKPSQYFDVLTYTGNGGVKNVGQSGASPSYGIASANYPKLISNSLRFRSTATTYLSRTPSSAGSQQKYTISYWFKRGDKLGASGVGGTHFGRTAANTDYFLLGTGVLSGNSDQFEIGWALSNTAIAVYILAKQFKDPSCWYHACICVDTTLANPSDRIQIYINGVRETVFSSSVIPGQNSTLPYLNTTGLHCIGYYPPSTLYNNSDYIAEFYFLDGQTLPATSFGQFESSQGVWVAKTFSGSYGTNGFYLNFSDTSGLTSGSNSGLGKDFSGNGNYWNTNNFTLTAGSTYEAMIDSPTNAASGTQPVGNYPTLNPFDINSGTISAGNLDISAGANEYRQATARFPSSGKWYYEFTVNSLALSNTGFWLLHGFGYGVFGLPVSAAYRILGNGASPDISVTGSGTPAAGHVIKVAYDVDNGKVWFGRDTLWFSNAGNTTSDPSTSTGPSFTGLTLPADNFIRILQTGGGAASCTGSINFGQRPFSYTPPTGFQSLCTSNFPAPAAGLWTPDLVWIKDRTTTNNHAIADTARGAFEMFSSNNSNAQSAVAQGVQRFYPGGFTVGSDATVGTNNDNYVGWIWRKGSTPGFNIVIYNGDGNTGRQVNHGLGQTPACIIVKSILDTAVWRFWHQNLTAGNNLILNDPSGNWAPTDRVGDTFNGSYFTVQPSGAGGGINASGQSYVAYCFAEVPGFSRFGSYTGNGSADGPFVWCGFKPKFILHKRTDSTSNWAIYDGGRPGYNPTIGLLPNLNYADNGSEPHDLLSNGFKIRYANGDSNVSGGTYIFIAFAEVPFKYANAR